MRAALFHQHGGPEVIRVEELAKPNPGAGEVRLRVCAAAMNHLDLWARRGLPFPIPMPHIGGSDIAGWVDAFGSGVDGGKVARSRDLGVSLGAEDGGSAAHAREDLKLGDRVVVDPSIGYEWYGSTDGAKSRSSLRVIGEHTQGGFAEFCIVPLANLVLVPDDVTLQTAAASALNAVTAWHGLIHRGALRSGESVLVTGASGGVATIAIQIAASMGARVYAITSGHSNVQRVHTLGAAVVYDRSDVDPFKALWEETGKRGVDLVFDSVGGAPWKGCLRSLAPRGRLVVYGATVGAEVAFDLRRVFWRQLSIIGTTMGPPSSFREAMEKVFDRTVRPVIDRVIGLDDVQRGHQLLENGDVFGKLVIGVTQEGE